MRRCRMMAVWLLAGLLSVWLMGGASAQDDATAQGRVVAVRACSSCHAVLPSQNSVSADGIPALPVTVQRSTVDAAWLRSFLGAPHQRMPSIALVYDEREALIAYLLSLKRQ